MILLIKIANVFNYKIIIIPISFHFIYSKQDLEEKCKEIFKGKDKDIIGAS